MPPASSRSASGTTGCPAPTTPPRPCRGMGRQGEGRGADRLHHLARQQEPAHHCRRGAGEIGPRHPRHADLAAAGPRHQPGACRRRHGPISSSRTARSTARSSTWARSRTTWLAVPARVGSQIKGPCSRIDLMKQHAGIDVQGHVSGRVAAQGRWLDPRRLPEGGRSLPQGRLPVRHRPRTRRRTTVDTAGAFFHSFGAELVDAKGKVTVKSDPVRQALEYCTKLAKFYPPDAPAWDDASNNKWLVSGKGALIMNPPSAWAVAKRDAPQVAEQCWTHGMPVGSEGPRRAVPALLLGHLELRQEQVGGQEPAACTCRSGRGREDG